MNIITPKYLLTASLMCLAIPSLGFASAPTDQSVKPKAAVTKSTPVLSKDEIEKLNLSSPQLLKLADSGNLDAIATLGYSYLKGIGGQQNDKLAFKYLSQGAHEGNPVAMTNLAFCLHSRIGCIETEQNKQLAHVWYQRAIDQGFIYALNGLGHILENGIGCANSADNKTLAFKLYVRSAHAGDPNGICSLAHCLQSGIGCDSTEKNKALAIEWLKKAATAGHLASMKDLAKAIFAGIGCDYPDKYEQSVFWLEKAADRGDVDSMRNLAWYHLEVGLGCNQDKPRARKLLTIAGEQGDRYSLANLAALYFQENNFKMALPYLNKICIEFSLNSLVGYIYFREKNYELALAAYERAQEAYEQGVRPGLIQYLRKKSADARKAARLPKNSTVNLAQKAALEAQVEALSSNQKNAAKLYIQLQGQLESMSNAEGFDAAKELANMKKMFEMATTGIDDFETSKKLERAKKLLGFLRNIEEKILLHEQSQEAAKIVADLRKKPAGNHDGYAFEVETKAKSSVTKETKEAATKSIANEKDLKHAHHNRPHNKPTTQKAKDAKRNPSPETVKVEVVKGPFADMLKPVKKTQAQLNDTCWNNVYKIRDTLRTATSLDNARGLLEALQGDFDFKEVTPAYAGIPNADLVFQMRINQQYRVLIAFEKVTEQVYEQGPNGENNNNPVEQVTYKLYGDTIYIDDPHKG